MTGRTVHDALLRVLTSAELRRRLDRLDGAEAVLGAEEAAVLRGADQERLWRLARFFGRHFYRERLVRLFVAGRTLARQRGPDPLRLVASDAFDALLETAEVGSPEMAERVAALIERNLLDTLAPLPYGRDLVAYEGALFRAEAGPRQWGAEARAESDIPVRALSTRALTLAWDVTGLVAAVRRGSPTLPEPRRATARLLVALAPTGRVTTVTCPDAVARLVDALDGSRPAAEVAARAGLAGQEVSAILRQLTEIGAIHWRRRVPAA